MSKYEEIIIPTDAYNKLFPLNSRVTEFVEKSGVQNGVVFIITQHTTTGITTNEDLECLKDDIIEKLGDFFKEDGEYYHARFLQSYSAMAGNPTGHLKAMLTGNQAVFPIVDGEIQFGGAQEVFLAEFDGPQKRTVMLKILGD